MSMFGYNLDSIISPISQPEEDNNLIPRQELGSSMPKWQQGIATSLGGNEYARDPDSAKQDAFNAAMREFGKSLLAAGLAPDYRGVGQAISGGIANFGDAYRGNLSELRKQREHDEDRAYLREDRIQRQKIFDVNYEGAQIDLRKAREDEGVRAAMKKAAKESLPEFDSLWSEIIDDPDMQTDPNMMRAYQGRYKFFRDAYEYTGSVESGAALMQVMRDAGEDAGYTEKVDKVLFDKLREAAAPMFGTDLDAVRKFVEYNQKTSGLKVSNEWLENQIQKERLRGIKMSNSMIESGAGLPEGYVMVPGPNGPIAKRDPSYRAPQEFKLDTARLQSVLDAALGPSIPLTMENINAVEEARTILQQVPGIEFQNGMITKQGYATLVSHLMGIGPRFGPSSTPRMMPGHGVASPTPVVAPSVDTVEGEQVIQQMIVDAKTKTGQDITREQAIAALLRNNKLSR